MIFILNPNAPGAKQPQPGQLRITDFYFSSCYMDTVQISIKDWQQQQQYLQFRFAIRKIADKSRGGGEEGRTRAVDGGEGGRGGVNKQTETHI